MTVTVVPVLSTSSVVPTADQSVYSANRTTSLLETIPADVSLLNRHDNDPAPFLGGDDTTTVDSRDLVMVEQVPAQVVVVVVLLVHSFHVKDAFLLNALNSIEFADAVEDSVVLVVAYLNPAIR